ncbi:MAG: hypothetical protein JWO03_2614 [Bacteroidetes bacterium]|nr:hypothetical protein [Bacteroidota bacterium]
MPILRWSGSPESLLDQSTEIINLMKTERLSEMAAFFIPIL